MDHHSIRHWRTVVMGAVTVALLLAGLAWVPQSAASPASAQPTPLPSPSATPEPTPRPSCERSVGCYFVGEGTAEFDNGLRDSAFRRFRYVVVFVLRLLPRDEANLFDEVRASGGYVETLDSADCLANVATGLLDFSLSLDSDGTMRGAIRNGGSVTPVKAACLGSSEPVPFTFPAFWPTYVLSGLAPEDGATVTGTLGPVESAAGQSGSVTLTLYYVGSEPPIGPATPP